jgi:polar amino acid transport system substrate-binding protein
MKIKYFLFAIFCYLIFSACSTPVRADTIILAADEWCPYNCKTNAQKPGYMIEIAKYAFEKKGHKVVYKILPWSRAIVMARSGKLNGIIGAARAEVPDFIFPKDIQGTANVAFFVKAGDSWRYNGPNSLKNIQLGIIEDYDYGQVIDEYVKAHKDYVDIIAAEEALELNIKKVLAGRIQATVETVPVMEHYLNQTGRLGLLSEAGTLELVDIYIAFSPKLENSKEYARILSDSIEEMRKTGKLEAILSKYGVKDWKR